MAARPQVRRELAGVDRVNIVSVGLFAYKGLWLTVLLYTLFIGMSVLGFRAWQRVRVDA